MIPDTMAPIKRLICWVFGHQYYVVQSFRFGHRKVGCARCQRYFAMHDGCRMLLDWDDDFEKFYRSMYDLARTNR